jgi:membrane protein
VLTRARNDVSRRLRATRERYGWIDHAVIAWERFRDGHGNHYAAAITYFSFLALFPLLLLAVAVVGFVLQANPDLQQRLFDSITSNLPGEFGTTVKNSIDAAVRARAGVGVLGLVGVALTGLGWVGNLRAAINAMWCVEPAKRNFFQAKLANLVVLAGLGLATLVSIGLTAAGTAFTDKILSAAGLDDVPGVPVLVTILGIVLAVAGDMVIFAWLLVRLPGADVPARAVLQGALLAAVGFEVLKIVGAYYIQQVTHSPAVGIFGSVIGILVWIYVVARYLLLCAAWSATSVRPPEAAVEAPPAPAPPPARAVSPLGIASWLFGAGAAVGGGAVAALSMRRRRRDRRVSAGG